MSEWNTVAAELEKLLKKRNEERSEERFSSVFRHPIVVTAVGSLLVTIGTHFVTTEYQRSEQKAQAIVEFEVAAPNELARSQAFAAVRIDINNLKCKTNGENFKLEEPMVIALQGKTCKDAAIEYARRVDDYVDKSSGSGVTRVRALFGDKAIQSAAKNMSVLLAVIHRVESHQCGNAAFNKANNAIDHLVEQMVRDINGEKVFAHPEHIDAWSLFESCSTKTICEAKGADAQCSS